MSTGTPSGFIDASLLEKIDKLFACNAGDYVDLPQLVVVGHQSSGKSSVLEGLTGLPFPRDKELCTRFATQITFRRSVCTKITASIIPAKDSSDEHKSKMKEWSRNMDNFDVQLFAAIMAEVVQVMGIGGDNPGPAFSRDVLVLEIAGPEQEHFSVIDVPGTFKRTTQGVTTKDDIALVDDIVSSYMSNPRSVMLVVVPCNVDIATQGIIELAEDLDPEGIRTLGVLTKPDLVDKGTESVVVDLIEDKKKHRLKLGWHLLRNPGQAELEDGTKSRNSIESSFFVNTVPWNLLDKNKIGIKSLRLRLQVILATHLRREFPKVKAEISQALVDSTRKLQKLGPKRQSQFEQTQFLMEIALRFQNMVDHALRSEYARTDFFDADVNVFLATAVVNRGEVFSEIMATSGHALAFDESNQVRVVIEDVDWEQVDLVSGDDFHVRLNISDSDINDVVHPNVTLGMPKSAGILAWLQSIYQKSRGFELGSFNPQVLALIMKQQSQKWPDIALGYVSDVVSLVHSFIMKLLRYVTPNDRVQTELLSLLVDQLTEQYRCAVTHTQFLLDVELQGNPATYNHYFADTLETCRQERMREQLARVSFDGCSHGEVVRLADVVQNHPSSNANHTVREIHDILRSYYKVARKRFVDNVRMQVADYFLVTGPSSPLRMFSPTFVSTLTAAQLDNIAGEELIVRRQREELEKRIQLLEDAKMILR